MPTENPDRQSLIRSHGSNPGYVVKKLLKRILRSLSRPILNQLEIEQGTTFFHNDAVPQKLLMQQYRLLAARGDASLPTMAEVGFRCYSQFEEDGILLFIFSLVPPVTRRCVEICAGNGRECMATNLIINHGWWGYLFDGNEHSVEAGRTFFSRCKDTFLYPPRFTQTWITAENVNSCLEKSGAVGAVDLLSLDIDGMDYWIWRAISVIKPRVVVCETQNIIPGDKALTVPYEPGFVSKSEDFRGASLAAMCKLGREKGYRLIGTHRYGFNAFFMLNGVGEDHFPEVSAASCLNDPVSTWLRDERWSRVRALNWQEV